jgi:hypothetical protein
MNGSHFVWWSSDGRKHEAPIRYFRLSARAVLVPHDRCVEFRNEGTQDQCRETRDALPFLEMGLSQK